MSVFGAAGFAVVVVACCAEVILLELTTNKASQIDQAVCLHYKVTVDVTSSESWPVKTKRLSL